MNRKYFFVCNPSSRSFKSREKIASYRRLLSRRSVPFEHAFTAARHDAIRLTREAARKGFDAVVAVGGDGTINEVINGILADDISSSQPSLGVLYSGTSPDFCNFHNIPLEEQDAVDCLIEGQAQRIDVGCMKGTDVKGNNAFVYFGSSVNIGIGAGIAAGANRIRRFLGDFLGTFSSVLLTTASFKTFSAELETDEKTVSLKDVLNITFAKNPLLASGMKLSVDLSPSDGKMFFLPLCGISKAKFFFLLPQFYSGRIAENSQFSSGFVSRVTITWGIDKVEAECDGDPAGIYPSEIMISPKPLYLIKG